MCPEETNPHRGKPKPARPCCESQNPIDAIVWAAYRKFTRGGTALKAMNLCLAEDRLNAKRRSAP